MNPNPKISVIVPVYNVEKYLRACVESILAQTFTDFELLLVDDGSPDGSGKICDEYAEKDKRVRVFHKENGGVTSARNLGAKEARGEWLNFVDGDDIIPENSLLFLVKSIDKTNSKIIKGGFRRYHNSAKTGELFEEGESDFSSFFQKKRYYCLFGALIKKTLFLSLKQPHNGVKIGEDTALVFQMVGITNKVYTIPHIVYIYRENVESVTGKNSNKMYSSFGLFSSYINTIEKSIITNENIVSVAKDLLIMDIVQMVCYYHAKTKEEKIFKYSILKNYFRTNPYEIIKLYCQISLWKSIFWITLSHYNSKIKRNTKR